MLKAHKSQLTCSVGGDGADGEDGADDDDVRDEELKHRLQDSGVADDVADAQEQQRAEHGQGHRTEHALK